MVELMSIKLKFPIYFRVRQPIWPVIALCATFFSFKKTEEETEDPLIMLLKRAKLAQYKVDLRQADQFYHQALDILVDRRQSGEWSEDKILEARVHIYDSMANLYLAFLDFERAEKLYKETMKGLLQMGREQTDNAIVEISMKLAMMYAMQQRNADAEEGYKFCVETQEKKLFDATTDEIDENTLALLGMCVNSYSRFLVIQNKFGEAVTNLKKSLDIAERVFGDTHAQVAVLYNDIATILSMKGDHASAREYADKAIKVGTKSESEDLPTYYCNYGVICTELKEFKEASRYCREAKGLAVKNNDKETEKEAVRCLDDIEKRIRNSKN